MLSTTIIAGLLLASNYSHATSRTVGASVTVSEACTMTSTNDSPHTATLSPNTYSGASGSDYENGIGKTTLAVVCNDSNGFAIYAIGYTGDSYDSANHTKLIGTNTNLAIDTAVYDSSDTTSSWSMKVNKITDSTVSYNPQNMSILNSFDSWHAVPASYTKVAQYHASTGSSTTDSTLGAKVTTTYAAYIAQNQPADTYIGQVKYTMVHPYTEAPLQPQPSTAGCINYHANASNAIGTMGCQSASDNASVTLLASNFSRTGYGFAGWSDSFDYATNPNAKFYGPQETITVPTGTTANGLSLYAVWVKSAGNLQESSKVAELCGTGANSLTTAPTDGTANLTSVSALTDQRDNNTYAIAKLADGKCWMIENLRLEADNTRTPEKQALAQGYGTSATYGNFGGLADAESTGFTSTYSTNSLYSNDGSNDTINIGTSNYPAFRIPRYNNLNTPANANDRPQNPTSNSFTEDNTTAGMYSYGNYYTWHAAIADTTYYYSGDHNTTSICPTGWQLPLGDTSTGDIEEGAADATNKVGGFSYLDRKMGGTGESQSTAAASLRWSKFPNNFLYSGYFNTSSARTRGGYGYYWSSTASNKNLSYYSYSLRLYGFNVYPGIDNENKYWGLSIRCTVGS